MTSADEPFIPPQPLTGDALRAIGRDTDTDPLAVATSQRFRQPGVPAGFAHDAIAAYLGDHLAIAAATDVQVAARVRRWAQATGHPGRDWDGRAALDDEDD